MMQLGAEGNFVGSGIFKSSDPERRRARSSRRPPTSTTPSGWRPPRSGSARRCRAWRSPSWPPRTRCFRTAEPDLRIGVLAVQGASKPTSDAAPARRRDARGRAPEDLEGLDGLSFPAGRARRSQGDRFGRAGAGDPRPPRGRRPVFGTCAGLIVCDGEHLGLIDATPSATRSGARCRALRRISSSRESGTGRSAPYSSVRPG